MDPFSLLHVFGRRDEICEQDDVVKRFCGALHPVALRVASDPADDVLTGSDANRATGRTESYGPVRRFLRTTARA